MRPLSGIRVLDLGIITAGAATSAMLADLGADVIKIESPTYRDPFRIWVAMSPKDADKVSPHYRATNRGKRAIAINLKMSAGRECFLRLLKKSDVVVENFRRGVLEKLNLGYAELAKVNPGIILASISSQGESGPDAMDVSYGSTLESVSGMAWLTGYEGGDPVVSGVDLNYPDQVVAIFAAGVIATAIFDRSRNGSGVHLDLSQRELTTFMVGESFATRAPVMRRGNADPEFALQDCFLSVDRRWVAVSISFDQVQGMEAIFDAPAGDLRDSVQDLIGRMSADEAISLLRQHDIPAALAKRGNEVLAAEEWSSAMQSAPDGLPLKGMPFDICDGPAALSPAPEFGEHGIAVLMEVGGYSRTEINDLIKSGVIEVSDQTISAHAAKTAEA